MSSPACKVTDILSLIPQRPPILMVDSYLFEDELHCQSALTITGDNLFLESSGLLAEEGVLEHIAQTAAAHIGYQQLQAGEGIRLGYIGDIKRCTVTGTMPAAGAILCTRLTVMSKVGDITLVSAETSVEGTPILNCRMKLASDNQNSAL